MRAMMQQEFVAKQVPRMEDLTDMSDPFYNALPPEKKEAYKDAKLEEVAKDINDTAAKADSIVKLLSNLVKNACVRSSIVA